MIRRLAALAVVIALVPQLASASKPTLQQRIEAQRAKQQQIQAQLQQKRGELNTAAARETDLQTQLDQTNSAINNVNAHIDDLAYQEASTQRKMAANQVQLDAAQRSLQLHDEAFKRRLVDIYENGDMNYLSVLLEAKSFADFSERWEDLRLLIASNERAVRERKEAQQRVAAVQRDLERTKVLLAQQQAEQERAKAQLAGLADERRNLVAVADQQRRSKAYEVAQLDELSANEEAELEQLVQERQRQLEAEREAQRRAAGIAGVMPPANESGPGSFSWPVTGTITSPYGWRSNPFGGSPDFHPGMDIAAPMGTTVTAAASGTVILAQWYGGYGNFIMLDNGGGYSTGYGHLSHIYVSVGQQVQRGQAIGAVGSTGHSTGPHLHFEVRINGKTVDPASHLH